MPGIPPNSLFSTFAFIGFLLASLSLPWHMQSWNIGTCMFMLWSGLGCLILFINSIVWNDNVTNWAPVWCDITAHYLNAASVGIPASSFCIVRRLYSMTKLERISVGKKERRREIMVDVSIGIGFPCIVMALAYVVQSRRFIIFEQIGCFYAVDNTLATYFLLNMWPLLIGLINLIYAVLTFRRALLLKGQLKRLLRIGFSISAGHYWRLMALCCCEIMITVPLSLFVIIVNAVGSQVIPYVSWAWIHSDFSQIVQYPTVVWQSVPYLVIGVETARWFYILCAFVIFAFFGWGHEARGFYSQAFWSVCRYLGYSKPSSPPLPTTVSKQKRRFTRAGEQTLPVDGVDRQMGSEHLPMPIKARVKRHSFSSSFLFEAPPRSESISSNSHLSVGEGWSHNPLELHPLRNLAPHRRISWESIPAAPAPALTRDRRLQTSSQDVGQPV